MTSMSFHSGMCFLSIRSFSLMSTSNGFTLDDWTDLQSSMSRSMSSSFLSSFSGKLLHLRCSVHRLHGYDVGGPVYHRYYRGRDDYVLRVAVLPRPREYHLEDRLPVLRVHVDVELVHRPERRDDPALEGEDE